MQSCRTTADGSTGCEGSVLVIAWTEGTQPQARRVHPVDIAVPHERHYMPNPNEGCIAWMPRISGPSTKSCPGRPAEAILTNR